MALNQFNEPKMNNLDIIVVQDSQNYKQNLTICPLNKIKMNLISNSTNQKDVNTGSLAYPCTGSIISKRVILTAAHCALAKADGHRL